MCFLLFAVVLEGVRYGVDIYVFLGKSWYIYVFMYVHSYVLLLLLILFYYYFYYYDSCGHNIAINTDVLCLYDAGGFMLLLSLHINALLGEEDSTHPPNVSIITTVFFALNFLAATQDIVVDGWALTILSRSGQVRVQSFQAGLIADAILAVDD